jgi:hypothetical protein
MEMADELQTNARRCLMSFKLLNFPPQASTRAMRVPVRWMCLESGLGGSRFLSSWLGDDNDSDQSRKHINWGAVAGLTLSFAISGGFWAGVGLLIARTVK